MHVRRYRDVSCGNVSAMILLVVISIFVNACAKQQGGEPTVEFRGLFMATVANIDWPKSRFESSIIQQSELVEYVDLISATHINAVMFQARTAGDAFYNSTIEPWSKYLTGRQGKPPYPYFDPLHRLITLAHERNIQVHAWLNPYCANRGANWDGLAPNHIANVYRQFAYPYGNYLWMDPGAQVVIDWIAAVVADIITRYDVDGIHFDDYFYPYPDSAGTPFPDNATYQKYVDANGTMSRDDWRRNNVNRMIELVYKTVKSLRPRVKFSVSPFGLYRPGSASGMPRPISGFDPFSQLYADSLLWLEKGWIDFMAPQLYWSVNSPNQNYPMLLDWWLNHNPRSRNIYASLGVYRIAPPSNWTVLELEKQIEISRYKARRDLRSLGNILFSAKYFRDNTRDVRRVFQSKVYTKNANIPTAAHRLRLASGVRNSLS